jgi:hypothetical protein
MKRFVLPACTTLLLGFTFPLPSLAQTLPSLVQTATNCEQHQETFGFQIPTYATAHQGGAILNIKVLYRLTPDAIAKNDYPDFVPIRKDIDKFFVNYPNSTDYWEIINKKLVQYLLDKYPQMSSLLLEINVMPTPKEPFPRSSTIRSTRSQSCPLMSM